MHLFDAYLVFALWGAYLLFWQFKAIEVLAKFRWSAKILNGAGFVTRARL
jgi:hypothetical protein